MQTGDRWTWLLIVVVILVAGCRNDFRGTTATVTAVPRFAFVADTAGAIASYAIDPTTGQLRTNGYTLSSAPTSGIAVSSLTAPMLAPPITVNRNGFLYLMARSATPTVVLAGIQSPTGRLAPVNVAAALEIVGHPSGNVLYIIDANSGVQAEAVDRSTGGLTPVGTATLLTSVGSVNGVSIDPRGRFLIAAGRGGSFPNLVATLAIDQATGAVFPGSAWKRAAVSFEPVTVVPHPSGTCGLALPLIPDRNLASFSIASDGTPTAVAPQDVAVNAVDLVFDLAGTAVFVLGDDFIVAFPITDPSRCTLGAELTRVGLSTFGDTKVSLEPSGRFLYATNPGLNRIDAVEITAARGRRGAAPAPAVALVSIGSFPTRMGVAGFAPVFTSGTLGVSYLPVFLYSVNQGSNDISIFSISSSGTLTAVGTRTSLGTGPSAIAIDPWSRFAYVANRDSGTVATFTVNRSTGALSAAAPAIAVGTQPVALTVDTSGRFLFVANSGSNDVRVFTINQATGLLATPGATFPIGAQPTSLAIDPTGTTLYVSNVGGGVPRLTAFTVNQTTGLLGATGGQPTITIGGATGIGVDVRGEQVFLGDTQNDQIRSFPIASVTADLVTSRTNIVTTGPQPVSIAVDPLGRFVYSVSAGDFTVSTFAISRSAPFVPLTRVSVTVGPARPRAAIVDPSGRFLYVAGETGLIIAFAINSSTGALTPIGPGTTGTTPVALAVARLPL